MESNRSVQETLVADVTAQFCLEFERLAADVTDVRFRSGNLVGHGRNMYRRADRVCAQYAGQLFDAGRPRGLPVSPIHRLHEE
jgi:hypothetical protein